MAKKKKNIGDTIKKGAEAAASKTSFYRESSGNSGGGKSYYRDAPSYMKAPSSYSKDVSGQIEYGASRARLGGGMAEEYARYNRYRRMEEAMINARSSADRREELLKKKKK